MAVAVQGVGPEAGQGHRRVRWVRMVVSLMTAIDLSGGDAGGEGQRAEAGSPGRRSRCRWRYTRRSPGSAGCLQRHGELPSVEGAQLLTGGIIMTTPTASPRHRQPGDRRAAVAVQPGPEVRQGHREGLAGRLDSGVSLIDVDLLRGPRAEGQRARGRGVIRTRVAVPLAVAYPTVTMRTQPVITTPNPRFEVPEYPRPQWRWRSRSSGC